MDAKSLIIELGDYVAVAQKIGVTVSQTANWKHRNIIPRKVWPDLLEKFPRKVTMARLKATETALEYGA